MAGSILAFVLAITGLDELERWLKRFDVTVWEGDDPSYLPWVSWGWVRYGSPCALPEGTGRRTGGGYLGTLDDQRFFCLRLPSFDYQPCMWTRALRWKQRALLWRESSGWMIVYLEPHHA